MGLQHLRGELSKSVADAVHRNVQRLPFFIDAIKATEKAKGQQSEMDLITVPFRYQCDSGDIYFDGDAPKNCTRSTAYVHVENSFYTVRNYLPSAYRPDTQKVLELTFQVFNRAQQSRSERT